MSVSTHLHLYWWRLRAHPLQELLAGAGVMIGVALAFAVMVANGSIGASSDAIVRSVIGTADLQLASRDSNGTHARTLELARAMPGVEHAAPVLDLRGMLAVGDAEVPVQVASIDSDLARMSGRFGPLAGGLGLIDGLMVTTAAAERLGLPDTAKVSTAARLPRVTLQLRGRAYTMPVAAILGDQTVGPLSTAPVAVLPLARLQRLAGMPGKVTRVLIDAAPGKERQVRGLLAPLASSSHVSLTAANIETDLLEQALGPSDWTTGFFAAISAMLGFMLAFNAMLLTAPERRKLIADMRWQGFRDRDIATMVLGQSTALGLAASTVGVGVGLLLAQGVFDASPHYLAPAFVPGATTVIGWTPVLVALGGGVLATCAAALPPLLDLRRGQPLDAAMRTSREPGQAFARRGHRNLLAAGAACAAGAIGVLAAAPQAALFAVALLAVSTVCATPAAFAATLGLLTRYVERARRAQLLTIAALSLRATTIRSLALAATGAIAVFGCVSIGGARSDLLRGIAAYTDDYVGTADLWAVNGNDNQATGPIDRPRLLDQIRQVDGVADARAYRGSFLDWQGRRVWIIARPQSDRTMLPASQLRSGDLARATARLRAGGWAAISEQLAARHAAAVGDLVTIPSPTGPARLRVAAITTNLGWTPGAVIVNARDYRRSWTGPATAIEIDVDQHADLSRVQQTIASIAGPALRVQTAADRAAGINASARQGLARLSQISTLLLIGAVLAMAAAMSAAIWQRRPALAGLKVNGLAPRAVWRTLLIESAIVLGTGCLTGVAIGTVGQVGIDRYLVAVTGFPVATVPAGWQALATFAAVLIAALVVVAVPGWRAAQVPAQLALQQE